MSTLYVPFSQTGYFSSMICDYLARDKKLRPFYGRSPEITSFKEQMNEKVEYFTTEKRHLLVEQLHDQYRDINTSEATTHNIDLLGQDHSFTITTGHQLNLFTGPLYFLYKIISVINMCERLKLEYPSNDFIPVYWMASEDHDFEEINYFNFKEHKICWDIKTSGGVGRLSTKGLEDLLEVIRAQFGLSKNAQELIELFENGYTKHDNLSQATRYIANELFQEYGLVIIDGDDPKLKAEFIPIVEKELKEKASYQEITHTTDRLQSAGYQEQVHPREINLFYLKDGLRERIIERDGTFYVNDTDVSFTKEEILEEAHQYPERFSPNALLRPVYQEMILPNLCYIGGGGELAYWFQLKDYFRSISVPYPIVALRNSVLLAPESLISKVEKLDLTILDLFKNNNDLKTYYTHQISAIDIDFSDQKEFLKNQFKDLYEIADKTDASFIGAVAAQEQKQLNGLDHLEKRLLKAQKRNLADRLERLTRLQDALFPSQSLQERTVNFSEFYIDHGDRLIKILKEELDPFQEKFTVITL